MKRTIDQWKNCIPKIMAYEQSDAAKMFAFEDAKADIMELYVENMKLRNIVRAIAYPCRGTPEDDYTLQDFARLIQRDYMRKHLCDD